MTGEEIRALRARLGCSARALGEHLGVDQATVLAWERGDRFATKAHAEAMKALEKTEKHSLPERASPLPLPWIPMADPGFWSLLRKLLAHPALRAEAERAAERYDDPADGPAPHR